MARLNLQQQPGTPEYLACFEARPGHKIVSMDFAALEPKVTAYYSRDSSLLQLYGPDAKPNDVYLFNATRMGKLGERILAAGYDPDNPTIEAIAAAKRECKTERHIAKVFTLSANYGAGPGKIMQTLRLGGVDVDYQTCVNYHHAFWQLYAQVKRFERTLLDMYYKNDGYILNGAGRPLTIDNDKLKDVLNRFIQSTGHDVLMRFLTILRKESQGLSWHPWLIDYHDETMVEVLENDANKMCQAFTRSLGLLNDQLGWDVKMTGGVKISDNLAQVKKDD